MMKFKKFLAVAMTSVMMFGVVATAVPAVSVYATAGAATDVVISATGLTNSAISLRQGDNVTFSATVSGAADQTVTWSIENYDESKGVLIDSASGKLEVGENAATGNYTIVATATEHNSSDEAVTGSVTVTVEEAAETVYVITTDKTGATAGEVTTVILGLTADGVATTENVSFDLQSQYTGVSVNEASGVYTMAITAAAAAGTVTIVAKVSNVEVATKNFVIAQDGGGNQGGTDQGTISLDVHYDTYTATITTTGDDKYLFLDVLKEGKNGKPDTISTTYCYPLTENKKSVTIDLSFLSPKKQQKIRAFGNLKMRDVADTETVPVQTSKISVKYKYTKANTGAGDWWKDFKIKNGSAEVTINAKSDLSTYSYHTQYSSTWDSLDKYDFTNANVAGATIIVRKEEKTTANGTTTWTAPPSAEVKVKIPALAKAPKVSIDYAKGTVKITNKQEYDVVTNGTVAWSKKGDGKAIDVETLRSTNVDTVLAVRTAATESKGESNPIFIQIKKAPELTVTNSGSTGSVSVTGDSTKALTYKLTEDGKSLILTGAGFEYKKTASDTSWKKTKAGDTTVKDTTSVIVRLQGNKQDETLPSKAEPITATASQNPSTTLAAGTNVGEVKVGNDVVLTIARDTTTNTTINFTVAEGKADVVATLEYAIGDGAYAAIPSAPLTGQSTDAITVNVRIKAEGTNPASDPLAVTIPVATKTPATAPTAGTNAGEVKVGNNVVLTIERDGTTNTTINFTSADATAVATLEYRIGSTGDYTSIPTSLADQSTAAITINVRVKETASNAASEPLEIVISAVNVG